MHRALIIAFLALALGTAHAAETARSKARALTLPTLQYRATALGEVLEDLMAKSREADPTGDGVNLISRLSASDAAKPVTLSVAQPTVERALTLLASLADLYIQYDTYVIVVERSGNIVSDEEQAAAEKEVGSTP